MDKTEIIIQLLLKRLTSVLTPEEEKEISDWKSENPEVREALIERLSDTSLLGENWRKRSLVDPLRPQNEMKERLGLNHNGRRMRLFTIAGAIAALIAIVLLVAPTLQKPSHEPSPEIAETRAKATSIDSIMPGETMAYVSSAGTRVLVDPSRSGSAGVPISQLRGRRPAKDPLVLEVPRGGEFIVILDDSTKVWLNSASVLTCPGNFTKGNRKVEISGEAYFAVRHDEENSPFYVESGGQQIRVYGTEFNVRAYPEEHAVYTSLKKGSVGLRRADGIGGELRLSPGQQAVFDTESQKAHMRKVDIETVTGWRNGRFVFQDQNLRQIMADLARWYDFEFEFADPSLAEMEFMGSIPRYSNFSTAMLILEKTGDITFSMKGSKVIVGRKQ